MMKALVMSEPGKVAMTELPKPAVGPEEVLVRIRAAGICINDVRDFKGEGHYSYPRIGGHEFAGEICEMGAAVNKNRFHSVSESEWDIRVRRIWTVCGGESRGSLHLQGRGAL